jgi:Ca-activated chloride channel family protein
LLKNDKLYQNNDKTMTIQATRTSIIFSLTKKGIVMRNLNKLAAFAITSSLLVVSCTTTDDQGETTQPQEQQPTIKSASTQKETASDIKAVEVRRMQGSMAVAQREKLRKSKLAAAHSQRMAQSSALMGMEVANPNQANDCLPECIIHAPNEKNNLRSTYQIFKKYGVNPTLETANQPISTFSMDVDSGSYKLAADMLKRNNLPRVEGIRIEEFINAFDYNYNESKDVFGVSAQVFPSPYRQGYHVLHVGVQTKKLTDSERNPSNLVLVADISGSMSGNNLAMLKQAFTTLVSQLNEQDSVSIVTYNNSANVALPATKVMNKSEIFTAINNLSSSGGTNAEQGIKLAYQQAEKMYLPGFNNRVILTSDGMANVGSTSPEGILKKITDSKDKGIFLTTVGVGTGNYNDHLLEQLANKGNGNYLYIGDYKDIQENFVDGLTSELQTVAKDAKVQVTFNKRSVNSYRLLGYENRALKTEDFTDPNKDGGEIGAGHSVTVIYEVKLNQNTKDDQLAEVAVSYKKPMGNKVHYLKKSIPTKVITKTLSQASPDSKLSLAASAFAEKLRHTFWSRNYHYDDIKMLINSLPLQYRQQAQVQNLQKLINKAQQLDNRADLYETEFPLADISFDRVPLLD